MKRSLLFLFCFFSIGIVFSHGGRTNAAGCHNDNIHGGYHCHNGGTSSSSYSYRQYYPELSCQIYYPGTYYDSQLKSCICPGGNIRRRDATTKSCPTEYKSCKESFGEFSIEIGNDKCSCQYGYVMNSSQSSCIKDISYENKSTSKKESHLNGWRYVIGGFVLFFIIKKVRE